MMECNSGSSDASNICDVYPIHLLVWHNNYQELHQLLSNNTNPSTEATVDPGGDTDTATEPNTTPIKHDLEKCDPRGRTPLVLAVTLGHLESTRVLLDAGANPNTDTKDGWSVVQEAVSTGDPDMVSLVLGRREGQRQDARSLTVPLLLSRLHTAPDFYVEMKWEFTSWMPLVSRMCPSDTYRVYKRGSSVRIDTTLLGFEDSQWTRGNRTYIFKGQGNTATMMELDHDAGQVWVEKLSGTPSGAQPPTLRHVQNRLTAPICNNYIDTEKISFERNKSGIWGWRSDKAETVGGWDCKVFSASNVELVTRTRTEHLGGAAAAAAASGGSRTPLHSLLGVADAHEKAVQTEEEQEFTFVGNPSNITVEEYFSESDLQGRDIGRPKELTTKIQKFRATLWLCDSYPLQLQEQIMPILDLMASMSSPHFAKLKDFIQLQLPSGFPVKIEIPLFHVLNARITFGNIYAQEQAVPNVACINEGERQTCIIDDEVFQPPAHYEMQGDDERRQHSFEDEDDLLQYAIQQSLIDAGSEKDEVDIWEALKSQKPSRPSTPNILSDEERQLQRAIQASLESYRAAEVSAGSSTSGTSSGLTNKQSSQEEDEEDDLEKQLKAALLLSQREEQERLQEDAQLAAILQLSLVDK